MSIVRRTNRDNHIDVTPQQLFIVFLLGVVFGLLLAVLVIFCSPCVRRAPSVTLEEPVISDPEPSVDDSDAGYESDDRENVCGPLAWRSCVQYPGA